jgi:hypothetical protein
MITLSLFKEHQKGERLKEAALQRLDHTVPAPPDPSVPFPENLPVDGPPPSTKGDSTRAAPILGNSIGGSPNPTLKTKSSTSLERKGMKHKTLRDSSTFYSLLCSLRNRLRARPITIFFHEQSILFSSPPTKASSKALGYLDLDPSAPQNQAILIHERWLRDGLRRLEFQLKTTRHQASSHERLLGVMLIRDMRAALDLLEKCKTEEWDRQYALLTERSAPVIDTGEKTRLIMSGTKTDLFVFSLLYVCSNTHNGTSYLRRLSIYLISPPFGQCLSSKLQHRFIDYYASLAPLTPRL